MNLFYWPFNKANYVSDDEIVDGEITVDYDEIYARYMEEALFNYNKSKKTFKGNNVKFLDKVDRKYLSDKDCVSGLENEISYYLNWKIKPSDLVVAFENDYEKATFSRQELENLKKLEEVGKKYGVRVGVFDYKEVYSYKEVENANKMIKYLSGIIKQQKYSPLEKLLHAYIFVVNNEYKSEIDGKESESQSRSIFGIMNSDKIVCVGFSNYLKALVSELDDPNLKAFSNGISTKKVDGAKSEFGGHRNNIVYIKDDKYKIDGFYYVDPTWDSLDENKNFHLNYLLVPIDQIKNIKFSQITQHRDFIKYNKDDSNDKKYKSFAKIRDDFNYNYSYYKHASVSKDKADFEYETVFVNYDCSGNILAKYLATRQDFKDFVIWKETMQYLKQSKKQVEKFLEENAKLVEEDITKTRVFNDEREMFKYLKQHSPYIGLGPIQDALHVVLKVILPKASKDEISEVADDIIKLNIESGKENFNDNKTIWTECEEEIK